MLALRTTAGERARVFLGIEDWRQAWRDPQCHIKHLLDISLQPTAVSIAYILWQFRGQTDLEPKSRLYCSIEHAVTPGSSHRDISSFQSFTYLLTVWPRHQSEHFGLGLTIASLMIFVGSLPVGWSKAVSLGTVNAGRTIWVAWGCHPISSLLEIRCRALFSQWRATPWPMTSSPCSTNFQSW